MSGFAEPIVQSIVVVLLGMSSIHVAATIVIKLDALNETHRPRHALPRFARLIPRNALVIIVLVIGIALTVSMITPTVATADPGAGRQSTSREDSSAGIGPTPPPAPTTMPDLPQPGSSAPIIREPQDLYQDPETPQGLVVAVDQNSVTYQLSDREYTTVFGGVQRIFADENGAPVEVDNTLVPVAENGQSWFQNAANNYQIRIPTKLDPTHGVSVIQDGFSITYYPQTGDYSRPVAQGNAVLFNDVWDGVDVQYSVIGGVVKEDILLNRYVPIPPFRTRVEAGDGVTLKLDSGSVIGRAAVSRGSIIAGNVLFTYSAPAVTDAAGAFSDELSLPAEVGPHSADITLSVDSAWLSDPKRVFPVRIDPAVTIGGSDIALIGVEQTAENRFIGDNGYPYAGYDNGVVSGNGSDGHGMTRTYIGINYNFSNIPVEAVIDSATFTIYQTTGWSHGQTIFGLYRPDSWWDTSWITWNSQQGMLHSFIGSLPAAPNRFTPLVWDVTGTVNDWVQGIAGQYGLVIKALDEQSMTAEVFANKNSAHPPQLSVSWSIPYEVDPAYPLDALTVNVHPVTEKGFDAYQRVDGVFGSGVSAPQSVVAWSLTPDNDASVSYAYITYRYPDSSVWEESLPLGTKYRDKADNWQTTLTTSLAEDVAYHYEAVATINGQVSTMATSDTFVVYRVKQRDTLPFIAGYYGVPLDTIMRDNAVHDTLAWEGNTLFIRNPTTNVPYNPGPLTVEQQMQIDSALEGRGKHVEYGYEPINLNTGNFWLSQSDVSVPDLGGWLELTRSYNSIGLKTRSLLGFGWETEYSQSLSMTEDGSIIYTMADGKTLTFTQDASGSWVGPVGFGLTLSSIVYGDDGEHTRYEISSLDGTTWRFNSWGLLAEIIDPQGLTTTVSYDDSFHITGITGSSGVTLTVTTDAFGRLSSVTRPDGVMEFFEYSEAGDLISHKDGNGATVSYTYSNDHRMTSWRDQEGHQVVTNAYDDLGRVVKQTDAAGSSIVLDYSPGQTKVTDACGNVTRYSKDDQNRTIAITYPDGYQIHRTYGDGNTLITDENGAYSYDAQGRLTSSTDLHGMTTQYAYDNASRLVSRTTGEGADTWSYSLTGDLVSHTNKLGETETYDHDSSHRVTSHTLANGGVEGYTYDGSSPLPATHTNAVGATASFAYNPMGQVTSITDALGAVTRFIYDREGNLTQVQTPDDAVTQYVLDSTGAATAIIDARGFSSSVTYDDLYNITSVTNAQDATTSYTYDQNSNKTSTTDPLGNTTANSYDARGRLTSTTDPEGATTAYTYDNRGNLTSITDPLGQMTTYTWDINRAESATDALGGMTTFAYTDNGRLASITQPSGARTEYQADALGRTTVLRQPSGLVTTLAYDPVGNVVRTDAGGRVTSAVYDAAGQRLSTTNPLGDTETYTYDADGRLVTFTDTDGQTWLYEWDPMGRMTSTTDPSGAVSRATYDATGNIVAQTDAGGNLTTMMYDGLNQAIGIQNPLGAVTAMVYDKAARLVETTDPLGGVTRIGYDKAGHATSVTDALGRRTAWTVDPLGRIIETTDPTGGSSSMTHDALGNLTSLTLPGGLETRFSYDNLGNLTKSQTSAGRVLTYEYDSSSRLVGTTDPVGRHASLKYDVWDEVVSATTIDQNTTTYEFDALGRVTSSMTPAGSAHYTYDPLGRTTSVTDVVGATTSYSYDSVGNLISSTDPLGSVTRFSYDRVGNLLGTTNPLGSATTHEYDAGGRPVTTTDARGAVSRYSYDLLGRMTSVTRGEGDTTRYEYDLAGELVSSTDPLGAATTYKYNPLGLLEHVTDAVGAVTTYDHDADGNLVRSTDPLGRVTTYQYSPAGELLKQTDPGDASYSYAYDAGGRLLSVVTPLGYKRHFTYDQSGNISKESDSMGRSVSYQWDKLHNLLSMVDPSQAKTSYEYDPRGNVTAITDSAGNKQEFSYDLIGRLTKETGPDNAAWTYVYDLAGNLTQANAPDETTTSYGYDASGNLTSLIDPLGRVTSYTYDANNRVIEQVSPSGKTSALSWDALDRLTTDVDSVLGPVSLGFDAVGNVTTKTDALGSVTTYGYDKARQLTSVTDPDGSVTAYAYDSQGNLSSVEDALGNTTHYTYDKAGNLTSVTNPSGAVEKWTYDPISQVTSQTKPGGSSVRYDYDEVNRLVGVAYQGAAEENVAYAYDSLGRRVAMSDMTGESSYIYDETGRMTSMTQGDGRAVTYSYDAMGRVSQIGYPDGVEVTYSYDDAGRLVSVENPSGTSVYEWNDDDQVASLTRPDGSETFYAYTSDGSVDSVMTMDASGSLVSAYEYDYDDAGRITSEAEFIMGDNAGVVTTERDFEYDENGRLISFTLAKDDSSDDDLSDNAILTVTYAYDAVGNRVGMIATSEAGNVETTTYSFDEDGRLTQESSDASGVIDYGYSSDGLLTSKSGGGLDITYEWSAADRLRVVKDGGRVVMAATYDGDGNRVFRLSRYPLVAVWAPRVSTGGVAVGDAGFGSDPWSVFWYGATQTVVASTGVVNGAWSLSSMRIVHGQWDNDTVVIPEGSITDDDARTLSDAGLTTDDIEQVADTVIPAEDWGTGIAPGMESAQGYGYELTRYVNDVNVQDPQVLADYSSNGSVTDYTYGMGRLSGITQTGAVQSYVTDGRGSVRQTLDSFSQVTSSSSYDAFGTPNPGTASGPAWGFNAEDYDPGSGLQYLRARYYDPGTGRFLSPDTYRGSTWVPQSLNLWTYTLNDPVNRVDPSGHIAKPVTPIVTPMRAVSKGVNSVINAMNTLVSPDFSQPIYVISGVTPPDPSGDSGTPSSSGGGGSSSGGGSRSGGSSSHADQIVTVFQGITPTNGCGTESYMAQSTPTGGASPDGLGTPEKESCWQWILEHPGLVGGLMQCNNLAISDTAEKLSDAMLAYLGVDPALTEAGVPIELQIIGNLIGDMVDDAADGLTRLFEKVSPAIDVAFQGVNLAWNLMPEGGKEAVCALTGQVLCHLSEIRDAAEQAWNVVQPYVDAGIAALSAGQQLVYQAAKPYLDSAWQAVSPVIDVAWEAAAPYIMPGIQVLASVGSKVGNAIEEAAAPYMLYGQSWWAEHGDAATLVGTVGFQALAVTAGVALTVASAGTASPFLIAMMGTFLVADTALALNDINTMITGKDLILESLLGGNEDLYNVLQAAVLIGSFIGPGGAAHAATKVDDLVRLGDDLGTLARHGDDVATALRHGDDVARLGDDAVRASDDVVRHVDDGPTGTRVDAGSPCTGSSCGRLDEHGNQVCFTAGTLVMMADGSSVAIEDVRVGDHVQTWDESTDTVTTSTVTTTYVTENVPTLTVATTTGHVTTTAQHPFRVENRGWVSAISLTSGDRIVGLDGTAATVEQVSWTGLSATVFNFEVASTHTYYVQAGNEWVLVHNDCTESGVGASSPPENVAKQPDPTPPSVTVQPDYPAPIGPQLPPGGRVDYHPVIGSSDGGPGQWVETSRVPNGHGMPNQIAESGVQPSSNGKVVEYVLTQQDGHKVTMDNFLMRDGQPVFQEFKGNYGWISNLKDPDQATSIIGGWIPELQGQIRAIDELSPGAVIEWYTSSDAARDAFVNALSSSDHKDVRELLNRITITSLEWKAGSGLLEGPG